MLLFISVIFFIQNLCIYSLHALPFSDIDAISYKRGAPMEQFYRGKNVLVTGGCGFIGSHIAEKLVDLGAHVTILDDLSTGFLHNIESIKNKVTLIIASITDPNICKNTTKNKDIIFHLAAFISVPQSVEEPLVCHNVNINGTLNLLEAARINNVQRFVFSSSSAVYGSTNDIAKETDPCIPTSPYGMSKRVGELYCQQYAQHYGLKTICLRYFNVYGPRQDPNGPYAAVVAKFTYQMKHNLPITIFGDGKQTRDFIPVTDVANANLQCGMLNADLMNGQPFNIATGQSINLFELIELLKQQFPNYTEQILFGPPRPGDTKDSQADCSKYFSLILGKMVNLEPYKKLQT